MRFALRVLALILGLIGAVVALVVNIFYSGINDILKANGAPITTHGWWGLLIVLVGFVGAILAVPKPVFGALLMAIAGIAFFFVVYGWALLASPFLLVGAFLAFRDRAPVATREPAKTPSRK